MTSTPATTETDIANKALSLLGQQSIASLSENNKRARTMNANYAQVRDLVLARHVWNCSIERTTLSPLSTSPDWGPDNAFQLPSDYIRLGYTDDPKNEYKIEGRTIVSDLDEIYLAYVKRMDDPSEMDELLKQAIATKLAADTCATLTGNTKKKADLETQHENTIAEAMLQDSIQQPSHQQQIGPDRWTGARELDGTRKYHTLPSDGDA